MNSLLVLKFGGAALNNLEGFRRAAEIIALRRKEFSNIVVIVSAMGDMTDRLLELANSVSKNPPKREQDMLVSVGERISMSLLAIVLADRGYEAISFTGSQAGIITCSRHSEARILTVNPKRILSSIEEGKIVIIAGFQGVSQKGEITTLGRGGSDTTAVAIAVAMGAKRVEFYKDVEGIFTKDPKIHKEVKKLPHISYQQALEIIAQATRKVLHPRAVELGKKNNIPLFVYSFKTLGEGSMIGQEGSVRPSPQYEEVCVEHYSATH